jgi:hypothetical protein
MVEAVEEETTELTTAEAIKIPASKCGIWFDITITTTVVKTATNGAIKWSLRFT